jgi:hypothetical protein
MGGNEKWEKKLRGIEDSTPQVFYTYVIRVSGSCPRRVFELTSSG